MQSVSAELPRCGVSGVSGLQQPHGRTRLLRAGHTPRVLFLFPRHLLSQSPHISKPRGPKAVDPQGARPPLCTQSASCSHLVLSMEVRLGHPASKRKDAPGTHVHACQPSGALRGRSKAGNRVAMAARAPARCSLLPAPSAAPTSNPSQPASRFVTPGGSSLLAKHGMTDGDRDVSQSRLPDLNLSSPRGCRIEQSAIPAAGPASRPR